MKTEKNKTENLSKEEKSHRKFLELFPSIKKKKTPSTVVSNVKRFHAAANEGLTTAQVDERINQGLVNKGQFMVLEFFTNIFFYELRVRADKVNINHVTPR